MSNKSTIVALALLVLLASCACLGAFASWTLNNATSRAEALATEAGWWHETGLAYVARDMCPACYGMLDLAGGAS